MKTKEAIQQKMYREHSSGDSNNANRIIIHIIFCQAHRKRLGWSGLEQ